VLAALSVGQKAVITMENHSIVGGLGSAVAEVMAENGVASPLSRIGIKDTYAHGASQKYLMAELGIDAKALLAQVEKAMGRSLEISDSELSDARIVDVHSTAKAEAL
jgi:transketolase